jgi:hypothetical protein
MLMQTNSYIVPKERRDEHTRLVQRFRQTLMRLGCDHFETYEQVGVRWSDEQGNGRFVQIMRFRDRKHQQAVEAAERSDPTAQALIREFCELVNLPYQQQQGLFAVGFYKSILPPAVRTKPASGQGTEDADNPGSDNAGATLPRRVGFVPPPAMSPVPPSASPGPISSPSLKQPLAELPSESDELGQIQSNAGPAAMVEERADRPADQPEPIEVAGDEIGDGGASLTWLAEPQVNGHAADELADDLGNGSPAGRADVTRPGHWVVSGERESPPEPADDALIADEVEPIKPVAAGKRAKRRPTSP